MCSAAVLSRPVSMTAVPKLTASKTRVFITADLEANTI